MAEKNNIKTITFICKHIFYILVELVDLRSKPTCTLIINMASERS